MTEPPEPQRFPERQRRLFAYVLLGVGLINLVLGALVGAVVTIGIGAFMLVAGGGVLAAGLVRGGRPPGQ
jgi:hypothetical protein